MPGSVEPSTLPLGIQCLACWPGATGPTSNACFAWPVSGRGQVCGEHVPPSLSLVTGLHVVTLPRALLGHLGARPGGQLLCVMRPASWGWTCVHTHACAFCDVGNL